MEEKRKEGKEEMERDVYVLAVESSCDETAAAVIRNGREILSNVISSQIALHTLYGGVVPELASRKHIENINPVIEQALSDAGKTLDEIDAIGVTYGPGLVGALLVGVAEAKAIAYAKKKPLIGVHHIEGHVCANLLEHPDLKPPFLCLIVSGGHTHLAIMKDYGEFEILGGHAMMRQVKPLIRWPELLDLVIRAAPRSRRLPEKAIRRPLTSPEERLMAVLTILLSAE